MLIISVLHPSVYDPSLKKSSPILTPSRLIIMSDNTPPPVAPGPSTRTNNCTTQPTTTNTTSPSTPVVTETTVPPLDPIPAQQDAAPNANCCGGTSAAATAAAATAAASDATTAADVVTLQEKIVRTDLDRKALSAKLIIKEVNSQKLNMEHANSTSCRSSITKMKAELKLSETKLGLLQLHHNKLVHPNSDDDDSTSGPQVVATTTPHNAFLRYLFDMCNRRRVESTAVVTKDSDGWPCNPSWFGIASIIGVCQQAGYKFPTALFPLANNGSTLYAIDLDRQSSTLVEFDASLITQQCPGQKATEVNLRSNTGKFFPPAKISRGGVKLIPFIIPLNADEVQKVVQSTSHPHFLAKELHKDSKMASWLRLASVHKVDNHKQSHLSVKLRPFSNMPEGVNDQIKSFLLDAHHSDEEGPGQMKDLFATTFTLPPETSTTNTTSSKHSTTTSIATTGQALVLNCPTTTKTMYQVGPDSLPTPTIPITAETVHTSNVCNTEHTMVDSQRTGQPGLEQHTDAALTLSTLKPQLCTQLSMFTQPNNMAQAQQEVSPSNTSYTSHDVGGFNPNPFSLPFSGNSTGGFGQNKTIVTGNPSGVGHHNATTTNQPSFAANFPSFPGSGPYPIQQQLDLAEQQVRLKLLQNYIAGAIPNHQIIALLNLSSVRTTTSTSTSTSSGATETYKVQELNDNKNTLFYLSGYNKHILTANEVIWNTILSQKSKKVKIREIKAKLIKPLQSDCPELEECLTTKWINDMANFDIVPEEMHNIDTQKFGLGPLAVIKQSMSEIRRGKTHLEMFEHATHVTTSDVQNTRLERINLPSTHADLTLLINCYLVLITQMMGGNAHGHNPCFVLKW